MDARQRGLLLGSGAVVAVGSLPFLEWGGGGAYVTVMIPPMAATFLLVLPLLAVPLATAAAWRGRGDDWLTGYAGSLAGTLPWVAAHVLQLGDPGNTGSLLVFAALLILVPYLVVGGVRLAIGSAARRAFPSPKTPPAVGVDGGPDTNADGSA